MLTPLQQRLLDIVGWLPEAAGFALAGGAALIMRGTVDPNTNDLDFFIGHADVEAETIATMVAAVERALAEAGIGFRREVVSDTFARVTVDTEHEECRIDLAVDVRMRPVEPDPRGGVLAGDRHRLPPNPRQLFRRWPSHGPAPPRSRSPVPASSRSVRCASVW